MGLIFDRGTRSILERIDCTSRLKRLVCVHWLKERVQPARCACAAGGGRRQFSWALNEGPPRKQPTGASLGESIWQITTIEFDFYDWLICVVALNQQPGRFIDPLRELLVERRSNETLLAYVHPRHKSKNDDAVGGCSRLRRSNTRQHAHNYSARARRPCLVTVN